MARPLQRPHSLYIEDTLWNRLVEHSARRGESASQFTNLVLRDALGTIPHDGPAKEYVPGDISRSATKPEGETISPKKPWQIRQDRLAAQARARLEAKSDRKDT